MKIVFVIFQVALVLLLKSGPLLAQGVHDEVGIPQSKAPIATDEDLLSTLVASGEAVIREKMLMPALIKNSEAELSETKTHAAEFSEKEPADVRETNNETEVAVISKETEMKR